MANSTRGPRVSLSVGSLTKEILTLRPTRGGSPEEFLARLDEYDIDWYITDKGDLMIRYWQIAAKDFVPKEHIARIRQGRIEPTGAESLEWVSKHLDELRVRCGGQWIGVLGNEVVASSSDLPGLMEALQQAGARDAFITQIPVEELIWRAVYGRQVL